MAAFGVLHWVIYSIASEVLANPIGFCGAFDLPGKCLAVLEHLLHDFVGHEAVAALDTGKAVQASAVFILAHPLVLTVCFAVGLVEWVDLVARETFLIVNGQLIMRLAMLTHEDIINRFLHVICLARFCLFELDFCFFIWSQEVSRALQGLSDASFHVWMLLAFLEYADFVLF